MTLQSELEKVVSLTSERKMTISLKSELDNDLSFDSQLGDRTISLTTKLLLEEEE